MKKPNPTGTDDVRARLAGLSPSARHLLQATTALPSPFRPARLSALEVAQLVGLALTNQQIAGRLGRSPHTVNFHLRQIFRKLGVASRVELVLLLGRREATR
ncbi:response regulator transcription factor [Paractinoplanes toevensis]|uniref:HTH luxR-type domain-containing protein n=1 Tax=Paractinoplanes toevensis TaxID=571911 RepID=A0A919T5B1_9ACTN|nr:hypothetical protein Ato02nite_014270 [Actinoplanes toevensis]